MFVDRKNSEDTVDLFWVILEARFAVDTHGFGCDSCVYKHYPLLCVFEQTSETISDSAECNV